MLTYPFHHNNNNTQTAAIAPGPYPFHDLLEKICESGYVYPGYRNSELELTFHSNDTLWDGRDWHSTSTCCSLHNPPYFTKTLSQTTTDDLELRMCFYDDETVYYDNIAVELVELYVKDTVGS